VVSSISKRRLLKRRERGRKKKQPPPGDAVTWRGQFGNVLTVELPGVPRGALHPPQGAEDPVEEALAKISSEALPNFEEVMARMMSRKSKNTVLAYRRDLQVFASWLGVPGGGEAVRVLLGCSGMQANVLVEKWLNSMKEAGLSPATRARRLATVKVVVEHARAMELITWSIVNETAHVEGVRDVRGPTKEQFEKLLGVCDRSLVGLRNRVVLLLLGGLGLRRVEVVRLKLKDLDRVRSTLRVHGKGDRVVYVALEPRLREVLEMWLHEAQITDPEAPIVHSFSLPGAMFNLHGINYIVSQIGKRAGVPVRPHGLRHTAISRALALGHGVNDVQKFSRHADVRMVQVYEDRVKDVAADVSKAVVNDLLGDWKP
jgi:integrase